MPNTKISALTAGNPAQGTDEIPIARGASNFKVTAASIAALSPAGTVTAVGGAGTVNGITLTGTVTTSGNLTLGGTLSGVSLTTQVSGTLPLANGGTGQTTKAAAFNALSPVTSTGDLIIGNGSNSNTRLAIGTSSYVLTSDGSTASWQPAAGGGGGVTSFDGGFTGLGPYSPTTGAVSLSGTLNASYGGTGTGTTPSNGQLLIGNGGGYSVANLTAGAGISITNSFGGITIAATGGGGGATINIMSVSTSSGSFNNSPPSSFNSKPLAASATSPSNYGAFVFASATSGFSISGTSISTIGIQDSTSTFTSFSSGPDFNSFPSSFTVDDKIVSCYGLLISNSAMLALFTNTRAAMTNPNLAPFSAAFSSSGDNPNINVSTSSGTFFKSSNGGIVIDKNGLNYIVYFGTGSASASGSLTVSSMSIEAGGAGTFPTTYFDGSDFSTSFAENTSNGMFQMQISVSNPTLQTLLNNSFRA